MARIKVRIDGLREQYLRHGEYVCFFLRRIGTGEMEAKAFFTYEEAKKRMNWALTECGGLTELYTESAGSLYGICEPTDSEWKGDLIEFEPFWLWDELRDERLYRTALRVKRAVEELLSEDFWYDLFQTRAGGNPEPDCKKMEKDVYHEVEKALLDIRFP